MPPIRPNAISRRPRNQAARSSGKHAEYLRFIVQKHAATRLHYDLRLEHDGVLKSWAVTKGPSCDPRDKRLAVEVEDHPLDYRDFEGTIPKGEYGGGTVMLWDRGFWMPDKETADVSAALRKGELKFIIAGEKLRGGWVLVRMKSREGDRSPRNNWLLISIGMSSPARTLTLCSRRTARLHPVGQWIRSPPAKAGAPNRSWPLVPRLPIHGHLAFEQSC